MLGLFGGQELALPAEGHYDLPTPLLAVDMMGGQLLAGWQPLPVLA